MKPSELIRDNYIIDLAEGLSDSQLRDFFDFCDKCFYVNSTITRQLTNLRKLNGKTLIKLNRTINKLEYELKEIDIKIDKLQKLRKEMKQRIDGQL